MSPEEAPYRETGETGERREGVGEGGERGGPGDEGGDIEDMSANHHPPVLQASVTGDIQDMWPNDDGAR